MATYSRFKLPPLKLTRQKAGKTEKLIIHRGENSSDAQTADILSEVSSTTTAGLTAGLTASEELGNSEFIEPTHHELQSKASVKGWELIRNRLLRSHTECAAMPTGQCCLSPQLAEYWCDQCRPLAFFCHKCFYLQHQDVNIHHTPKQWKVKVFVIRTLQ